MPAGTEARAGSGGTVSREGKKSWAQKLKMEAKEGQA